MITKGEKIDIPLLLKRAQRVFNLYIRLRDTMAVEAECVTCGVMTPFSEMTAGHFFGISQHSSVRFNEENVHAQCTKCNLERHGMSAEFRLFMHKKFGTEKLNELERLAMVPKRWRKEEILSIHKLYKSKICDLGV